MCQSKKQTWKAYHARYPDGIKKTKFYEAISACNFKTLQVLRGLCNICDQYGFKAFQKLEDLLTSLALLLPTEVATITQLKLCAKECQHYLRTDFSRHVSVHSATATHCLQFAFADSGKDIGSLRHHECSCASQEHLMDCDKCNLRFYLFEQLYKLVDALPAETRDQYLKKCNEIEASLGVYVGHIMRGVHQRGTLAYFLENLKENQCVVLADYKMKYLFQAFRENCSSWYAKRGASILGILVLYRDPASGELMMEYHDIVSEVDCRQDWFFSCSGFEATIKEFRKAHPHVNEEFRISDNGAHFHNTALLTSASQYYKVCNAHL